MRAPPSQAAQERGFRGSWLKWTHMEEQDSLPPLGWLSTMNYPKSHAQQRSFFHPGVMGWHPGMQPDPDNP
jgi:hypothetical protein